MRYGLPREFRQRYPVGWLFGGRGLTGLGDAGADAANLSYAGQQLYAIKQQLLDIDDTIRNSPEAARALGRDQIAAWNRYTELVSYYQQFRVLLGLDPDPGLSGLGQFEITIAGGITLVVLLAFITALATTVGYLWSNSQIYKQQAAIAGAAAVQAAGGAPGSTGRIIIGPDGKPLIVGGAPPPEPKPKEGWAETLKAAALPLGLLVALVLVGRK